MNRTPEEILAYCEEATEGPWGHERAHCMCLQCAYGRVFRDNDQKPSICLEVQEYQDAEFIVNARADLPRMAKEVLRLRALCGEAYERLNEEATSYAMVTSSRVHPNTEELLDKLKAAAEGK